MNNSTEETNLSILGKTLTGLQEHFDILNKYLVRARPAAVPPSIYDSVQSLINSLPQVNRQITILEEEQLNLHALAEMGEVVNSSLDLDTVLQLVMDTVIRLTGAERGYLALLAPDGEISMKVARNWEQETLDSDELIVSRTVMSRVVSGGEAVLTTNAQEDPRFNDQQSVVSFQLHSILCVPMKIKHQVIGLVYVDNRVRSGIFSKRHHQILSAFANQAAVAIENARLFTSIQKTLAEVIALKNLMNNVLESIASGVLTADLDEHITLANRAAEAILGKEPDELVGQNFQQVMNSPEISPLVTQVMSSDQPVLGVEASPTVDGRGQVDLRLNISPLKDNHQTTQGVAIVIEDVTEKKRLEAQKKLFERMVAPAVIRQINPNALQLGGKRAEITVVFADLRGFTSFAEQMEPESLVRILNLHLAAAVDALLGEEGTIDKFLGDAVMAWFNAPILQADHALRAIRAALAIRERIATLALSQRPTERLSFGIGIHTGEAVLGLVGTESRLDYTAIGDSVNTAKRIQENAAAGQILISQEVYRLVKPHIYGNLVKPIQAKGKRLPLQVYEVRGLSGN